MRVLHVHSGNLYGGVETLLATLWRERAACPSMETQFALCFEGRLSRELRDDGATVHALGVARVRSPLSVRRSRRALARLLGERAFDIAVCHSSWTQALFGPVVRAQESLPLVFWMHAPPCGTHWLERWARRTTPDLVVCNSRFTAESLGKLYPRAHAEVVYCPLSAQATRLTPAERASLRAEFDTHEAATVVLQAGRLERLKGHVVHLEALGLLRDVPGWVCWQAGGAQRTQEEKYLNELKGLASRLGIGDRVRFVGERSDVRRLMAAADIYCQPNVHPDSFGLTFAEALRAGLPVVTTGIGGAREVVDDSCGVLVPRGDARALAFALRELIESPTMRGKLSSGGPRRARRLCDPATRLNHIRQLFDATTRRERRPRPDKMILASGRLRG